MKKIGLAISGGGIKSFAAIGVMKYLTEIDLKPVYFAGTSMGSVIASFMAVGMSVADIEKRLLHLEKMFTEERIVSPSVRGLLSISTGYADSDIIESNLSSIFQEYGIENISDVRKPLVIPAVDLTSGLLVLFTNRKKQFLLGEEVIVIDDVPLATAVTASCSFPLVFKPKVWNKMTLVDGGVLANLPVTELRIMGADMILSVTSQSLNDTKHLHSIFTVGKRVLDLMFSQSTLQGIPLSDLNINVSLETDNPFETNYGKVSIEKGYETASEMADSLYLFKREAERILPFFR